MASEIEDRSVDARVYRQGSFLRVFAGQLLLFALTTAAAIWIASTFGASVVLVASLVLVAASAVSVLGPAVRSVSELSIRPSGIEARRYFTGAWTSRWEDLSCVLVFEAPTFGTRYRVKIVSREAGTIIVTDLIDDFEGLIHRLQEFAPGAPPCRRSSVIERLFTGG